MTSLELDESDLQTELFLSREPQDLAEYLVMVTEGPVRVTHLPTGISAIGEVQGNQVKNKAKAIELLKEQLLRNAQLP